MNKYNFQIIPPHSGKIRQVSVHSSKLKWVLGLIIAFIAINVIGLGANIFLTAQRGSAVATDKENLDLSRRLDQTTALVDSFEQMLTLYSESAHEIREYVDLPDIPDNKLAYGIGGPQLPYDPNEPLILARTRDVNHRLDSLILAAQTEQTALEEARESFEKNKKRFAHTPSIWPMRGYISSGFGKRLDPFTGIWKFHEGIDICARKGTPVYATADGRVKFSGWYHGYGKTVKVDHIYFETRYGHLDEIRVKAGQRVKRGDIIGTCGRTGYATGIHLHYEVRISGKAVDPKQYLYPDVVLD